MRLVIDIGENLKRFLECVYNDGAQLDRIEEKINTIMANQEEFDEKITQANEALDNVSTQLTSVSEAIAAESAQINDFILANPTLNTSALDGVVARLNSTQETTSGLAESVSGIFTPPEVTPQTPSVPVE